MFIFSIFKTVFEISVPGAGKKNVDGFKGKSPKSGKLSGNIIVGNKKLKLRDLELYESKISFIADGGGVRHQFHNITSFVLVANCPE